MVSPREESSRLASPVSAEQPRVHRLRCNNPGPMTLDGTNTWVISTSAGAVIIDPGPADTEHRDDVLALADRVSGGVALVLITHHHGDHTGGIDGIRERRAVPVRAARAECCRDADPLEGGEMLDVGEGRVTVLRTPGHSEDSLSLGIQAPGARCIATGDTILGQGTSVLEARPGALADYLRSLDSLDALGEQLGAGRVGLTGHGPPVEDVSAAARAYREHRLRRINDVARAVEETTGDDAGTAAQTLVDRCAAEDADPVAILRHVVAATYPDLAPGVVVAATASTWAALDYLAD